MACGCQYKNKNKKSNVFFVKKQVTKKLTPAQKQALLLKVMGKTSIVSNKDVNSKDNQLPS